MHIHCDCNRSGGPRPAFQSFSYAFRWYEYLYLREHMRRDVHIPYIIIVMLQDCSPGNSGVGIAPLLYKHRALAWRTLATLK